jgi:hypothetical protein
MINNNTTSTWAPQVPLNVRKMRAAKRHINQHQRVISLGGLDGSGELNAIALQSGDY